MCQAALATYVTVSIQASADVGQAKPTPTDDEGETTIYSTATITDSNGAVKTTLLGSVLTYLSVGYSESVITMTTSVPVTSTYTSAGPSTVLVVTTYTVQTTSCVTMTLTSMIVLTVSTEKFTLVSCPEKICLTIYTTTEGALPSASPTDVVTDTQETSETDEDSQSSPTGVVTISTISGTKTDLAVSSIVTTIESVSGQSTILITTTKGSGVNTLDNSGSKSVLASRANTLTFQDNAVLARASILSSLFGVIMMLFC